MFQIHPLSVDRFAHLNGLDEDALKAENVQVHISDGSFPCRVSLADVTAGHRVFLLNFEHQPGNSPYRSRHAIFVAEGAQESHPAPDSVPEVISSRLLSVRAFNAADEIVEADVIDGQSVSGLIETFFDKSNVSYIHLHYARQGCFAAKVTRAA